MCWYGLSGSDRSIRRTDALLRRTSPQNVEHFYRHLLLGCNNVEPLRLLMCTDWWNIFLLMIENNQNNPLLKDISKLAKHEKNQSIFRVIES